MKGQTWNFGLVLSSGLKKQRVAAELAVWGVSTCSPQELAFDRKFQQKTPNIEMASLRAQDEYAQ